MFRDTVWSERGHGYLAKNGPNIDDATSGLERKPSADNVSQEVGVYQHSTTHFNGRRSCLRNWVI
jgi:hypothetical protein